MVSLAISDLSRFRWVSQYSHAPMSTDQRDALKAAMQRLHKREYEGITVTWAHVECDRYLLTIRSGGMTAWVMRDLTRSQSMGG